MYYYNLYVCAIAQWHVAWRISCAVYVYKANNFETSVNHIYIPMQFALQYCLISFLPYALPREMATQSTRVRPLFGFGGVPIEPRDPDVCIE